MNSLTVETVALLEDNNLCSGIGSRIFLSKGDKFIGTRSVFYFTKVHEIGEVF